MTTRPDGSPEPKDGTPVLDREAGEQRRKVDQATGVNRRGVLRMAGAAGAAGIAGLAIYGRPDQASSQEIPPTAAEVASATNTLPLPSGGDDTDLLNDAFQAGGHLTAVSNQTYFLRGGTTGTTGLKLNASTTRLVGQGMKIDASGMPEGIPALTVTRSDDTTTDDGTPTDTFPSPAHRGGIEDVYIQGPANAGTGVVYNVPSPAAGRDLKSVEFRNVIVDGFAVCLSLQNNTYNDAFYNCTFTGAGTTAIEAPFGDNAGELVRFVTCNISNSAVGIDNTNGGELLFLGCSIDYNNQMIKAGGGGSRTHLIGCHLEGKNVFDTTNTSQPALTPITISGGGSVLDMIGGSLTFAGGGTANIPYVIDNSVKGTGGAVFRDVKFVHVAAANGYFANDTGDNPTRVEGSMMGPNDADIIVSTLANKLADGGFEQVDSTGKPLIVDNWYISADTAAIANRFNNGGSVSLSVSPAQFHSGKRSLMLQKTGVPSTSAKCQLAIPVTTDRRVAFSFWWLTAAATNSWQENRYWATMADSSDGVPATYYKDQIGSTLAHKLPVSGWQQQNPVGGGLRPPPWATHLVIEFVLSPLPSGAQVFIDDFVVTDL